MQQRNDDNILDKLNKVHKLCPHGRVSDEDVVHKELANERTKELENVLHEQMQLISRENEQKIQPQKDFNADILQMRKMLQEGRAEREDENLKHQRVKVREMQLARHYQRVRELERHL